jgi:hypothetical protein
LVDTGDFGSVISTIEQMRMMAVMAKTIQTKVMRVEAGLDAD